MAREPFMGAPPPRVSADEDILLTADEVVDRLMQSPDLQRVASSCVLPAVRCGAEWRFRKRDLDAWIERQSGS